jgi:hypothetical protein
MGVQMARVQKMAEQITIPIPNLELNTFDFCCYRRCSHPYSRERGDDNQKQNNNAIGKQRYVCPRWEQGIQRSPGSLYAVCSACGRLVAAPGLTSHSHAVTVRLAHSPRAPILPLPSPFDQEPRLVTPLVVVFKHPQATSIAP